MHGNDWTQDAKPIRNFVELATAEGLRPSSLDQGRGVLLRYSQFLREQFNLDLTTAGWKEFAAYKGHLAQSGIARTTARGYLSYIITFYHRKAPQGEIGEMDAIRPRGPHSDSRGREGSGIRRRGSSSGPLGRLRPPDDATLHGRKGAVLRGEGERPRFRSNGD